jgi:hypothetical protein
LDAIQDSPLGPRETVPLPLLKLPTGFHYFSLFCLAHWIRGNLPLRRNVCEIAKCPQVPPGWNLELSRCTCFDFGLALFDTFRVHFTEDDPGQINPSEEDFKNFAGQLPHFFDRNPKLFENLCSLVDVSSVCSLYALPCENWVVDSSSSLCDQITTALMTATRVELTQLFIIKDPHTQNQTIPIGVYGASLELRKESNHWIDTLADPAFESPLQLSWMLIAQQGFPSLVVFTSRKVIQVGDNFAHSWSATDGEQLGKCLTEISGRSHIHLIAYCIPLLLKRQTPQLRDNVALGNPDCSGPPDVDQMYHAGFDATDTVYEVLRSRTIAGPRAQTVGEFLVQIIEHPPIFFEGMGWREGKDSESMDWKLRDPARNRIACIAALRGLRSAKECEGASGRFVDEAYHEFCRYQQWLRNLQTILEQFSIAAFLGWIFAIPARCPDVVAATWLIIRDYIVRVIRPTLSRGQQAEIDKVIFVALGNSSGRGRCFELFGIEGTTGETARNLVTPCPLSPEVEAIYVFVRKFRETIGRRNIREWADQPVEGLRALWFPVTDGLLGWLESVNLRPAITL